MSATLEQQLDQFATDNSFTTVAVGRTPVGERVIWTATVHWKGFARSGTPCAHGNSDNSIQLALMDALTKAAIDRTPEIVGALTLAPMQEAA